MKMNKLVTTLAAVILAVNAHAQNITATFNTVAPGANVRGTFDNSNFHTYASGVVNFTSTGGPFQGFCAEPLSSIGFGETLVYQVQSPFSLTNYDQVGRIVTAFLASSQSNAEAAAAQWAIWEVTNEMTLPPSLANGNNRITLPGYAGTQVLADQYLANIYSFAPTSIVRLANPTRQDIVTWTPAIVAIPEPTSLLLCTVSGLSLLRRRRN